MSLSLIHPITVHFPIAFYFLELFLIILWLWKRDEQFRDFSLLVFRLAFITMIAALIAGWIDTGGWDGIQGKVKPHFYGASGLFVFQVFRALYWQFGKPHSRAQVWICLLGSMLGCALVFYTAYYGGEIVYGTD